MNWAMTKATDQRPRMFSGFGGDEAAEPTAFGKVGLASAAAIAILIGGWVSLRPQESEAAGDLPKASVADAATPDDEGASPADRGTPEAKESDATHASRTEAVAREPVATATTPVLTAPAPAPEPARKPARKRVARPKSPTPPPADKPKQTSGMGPL